MTLDRHDHALRIPCPTPQAASALTDLLAEDGWRPLTPTGRVARLTWPTSRTDVEAVLAFAVDSGLADPGEVADLGRVIAKTSTGGGR